MFGVAKFKDQIVVIAGAEHPVGVSLVRRFAGFGALVVAIGSDENALREIASERPSRIEPLALHMGSRNILALLQEAWAEQPLNVYIDVFPLCELTGLADTHDPFARSAALAAAFAPGMAKGRAQAILTFAQRAGAEAKQAAGYAGLVRHFSKQVAPGRFVGVAVQDPGCNWTGSDCLSMGDAILMLCHPVSRGVMPGSVVKWSA